MVSDYVCDNRSPHRPHGNCTGLRGAVTHSELDRLIDEARKDERERVCKEVEEALTSSFSVIHPADVRAKVREVLTKESK